MKTLEAVQIPADAIEQVVTLVFQTFLGQEVYPSGEAIQLAPPVLAGCVEISGYCQLRLEAAEPVARQLASRFLAMEPAELSPEDVRDALGEITNMVTGNFKSAFLPGNRVVAPPLALEASGDAPAVQYDWKYFDSEDGPFRLALHELQT